VLRLHQTLLAKAGLEPSECEDAIGVRMDRRRVCVADGATEAFDSRFWARLLTKHWVRSDGLLTKAEMEDWWATLGHRLTQRWACRPLPWYAEEKAAEGAFAAFLGVAFQPGVDGSYQWQAVALGDACLVHRRGSDTLQALPLDDPDSFGFHPRLVPSSLAKQAGLANDMTFASGVALPGDVVLLLTDAIAAWYLRKCRVDPLTAHEFERVLEAGTETDVRGLLTNERDTKCLRNDDVAAVLVRVDS
jgi:hypothetical protein